MCPRACTSTIKLKEQDRVRSLRTRLKRNSETLKAFEVRLLVLHADQSGSYRLLYSPPLIDDEYRSGIGKTIAGITRAAAAGCPLSAAWLEETTERRARIDALRAKPLPEREADYRGPEVLPTFARRAARNLSPEFLKTSEDAASLAADYLAGRDAHLAKCQEIAAERMGRFEARKARGRALLEEFLAEEAALRERRQDG